MKDDSYFPRSLAFFAVDYPAELGNRLPTTAQHLKESFEPDDVKFKPGVQYLFKWWNKNKLFLLMHNRFSIQTLGLDTWIANRAEFAKAIAIVIKGLDVTKIKRIGFKLVAPFAQEMTHPELVSLFFGTYFAPVERMQSLVSHPVDAGFSISGTYESMELILSVAPYTSPQLVELVQGMANIEWHMRNLHDSTAVQDFLNRLELSSAIVVDTDLFCSDVSPIGIETFLDQSLRFSQTLALAAKGKVLSLDTP